MKVTKRRGAWVVDFYDFGKRRVKVFPSKRDAEDFAAETRKQHKQRVRPTVDPHITVKEFSPIFLDRCRGLDIKPRTVERYETALRDHILPALGHKKVRDLDRPAVEAFIRRRMQRVLNSRTFPGTTRRTRCGTRSRPS